MARKKEIPKPLFDVRGDFTASLEHTLQQVTLLIQAVEFAIRAGAVPDPAKAILEERITDVRHALMNEWDEVVE